MSHCKDASELTFEQIKSSTDFVCAKKNMDGNILAVNLIMQSIYVHFYGDFDNDGDFDNVIRALLW